MPFVFNPITGKLDLINSGTVTSVAATVPTDLTVTGSPITSSGTLAITRNSQTGNLFLASPDGAPGIPSYRAIVAADVPILNQNTTGTASNVTGVVAIVNGGTGQITANAAFNALAPSQTGQAGLFLSTDGSNTLWAAVPGGTIPSAHQSSTSVVTSATTTYVTAISTTITTTASSAKIYANATATLTTTTAASVAKYRVSINGVAGQEQLVSLTATATNYTAAVEYISAALGPGTYTILFEVARNSGTGTVNFFEGTLDAIGLQGANSNGITQITGLGLNAGPGSGLQSLTGTLTLAGGGTNASLTAANGAIPYSTATALALLAPGSANQLLRSAGAAAPTWTTATYPNTTTINQILYSSAANTIVGLATTNTGALVTSSTGVPSLASGTTANRLLRTNGTTVSFAQANLTTDVTGTLPFANGGTGITSFPSQRVPYSNGTTFATSGDFLFDFTNTRLSVGTGGGSGTLNVVPTAAAGHSTLGLNIYSQTANHSLQIQNQAAMAFEAINANAGGGGQFTGVLMRATISRGDLVTRTAAKSGDQVWRMSGLAYYDASNTGGETNYLKFNLTEDYTVTNQGGEISIGTTPNGTTASVERLKILNSGEINPTNTHIRSTQTTAPTVVANASAGTGATASMSNATDIAGSVTLNTGILTVALGSQLTVTFNKTYAVAPIIMLTPANINAATAEATLGVYVTATTTTFDINLALAGIASTTYKWNYQIIETQ